MNLKSLSLAVPAILALMLAPGVSFAKGKHKQEAGHSPAERLAPYVEHIDQLLTLKRPAKSAPVYDTASGKIAVLKESFNTERSRAEDGEKAALGAAIETCDRLLSALDERQKALSQIKASSAVENHSELGRRRKDTLSQGVHGKGIGKAAGVAVEADRERAEKEEEKKKAMADDQALTAISVNHWNQHSIELRKEILAAYAGISQAAK